jgi:hypothetical protein
LVFIGEKAKKKRSKDWILENKTFKMKGDKK